MNLAYVQSTRVTLRATGGRSCASCDVHGCTSVAGGRMPGATAHGTCASVHGGFTLLEVLIAIVVLSIGLLGLAGLQATGLRNNTSAYMRTMATQQAYDMADRMRANVPGVITNAYDNVTGTGTDPGCITTNCTVAQLAQYDAFDWNTLNRSLLPLGAGTISRVASPAGVDRFTISVSWDDNRTGAANTTFSITTEL